ncbi:MAG: hypothetical protein LKJ84_01950 [Bacilli bacterium]|jgi:hypothetical protein|nr:hypothetical protein [Bacilli bacterium]
MKQIISFEKEIAFKTMIGEVTSISLEHTLSFQGPSTISGDMIVSGTYKMTEASTLEEDFQYAIPVDIMLTKELEEDNRSITIHNFTYDIRNEDTLHLYIDVLVKGREVIELEEDEEEVIEPVREEQPKIDEEQVEDTTNDNKELLTDIEVEESQKVIDNIINTDKKEEPVIKNDTQEEVKTTTDTKVMNSIFSAFANTEETYTTYSVYLLRENDSIENIIENYGVTREELSYYNDLDNLNVGSKIIIPTVKKDATAS